MTRLYHSLDEALTAIDVGTAPGGCRVVVAVTPADEPFCNYVAAARGP
ncbi:MAG TPA: hypothetical protein VL308_09850 [Gemmatimonadaceae bacterium]|jgi:hypothetical protein|nr:hypothetical protein [Gemmatimonadaceae bacterium]